ncbi:MAG: leucyl aminopeptidase, partial [Rubrivivax sp.]
MDFKVQTTGLEALATAGADALIVVLGGDSLPQGLDAAVAKHAQAAIKLGDFTLKAGQAITLTSADGLKAPRLVLAASGKTTLAAARSALASGLAQIKSRGVVSAAVTFAGFADELAESLAEQAVLAATDAVYLYRHTKPSAPAAPKLAKVTLVVGKDSQRAAKSGLARGEAIAAGIELARECANRPANYATPTYLGQVVQEIGKAHGLKVDVLDRKAVEKLGMGSFLAVAQGSDEPLRFIVARYEGAAKTVAPVVLVGKGITFDTGGISLKPGAEMDEMKFDMGGAAGVIGA